MRFRFLALFLALLTFAAACSGGETDPDAATDGEQSQPDPAEPETEADTAEAEEGTESDEDGEGEATPTAEPELLFPENALVIGVVYDRTGPKSHLDAPALEAARVQVARINQEGGVLERPLVLQEFDSKSQLNASFQAANELVDDDAELFLVTCDYQFALPAIEIATQANKLVFSPCGGTPEWRNPAVAGRNVFSFATPSAAEGELMADLVRTDFGSTVTMIVDVTDADARTQCEAFEAAFREGGGTFRGRLEVTVEEATEDLDDDISSLIRTSFEVPAAVVLCSSPLVGQEVVHRLGELQLPVPIVAGSTMDGSDWIVNVGQPGEIFVLSYASTFGDDPNPNVNELFDEYAVLTGERPDQGRPVTGADAILAFAIAAERAGTLELDALISELEAFRNEPLVGGTVSFSSEAHLNPRSMRLLEIVDRKPTFVRVVEVPGAAAAPEPEPESEDTETGEPETEEPAPTTDAEPEPTAEAEPAEGVSEDGTSDEDEPTP